jgi:hypothetical protein
MKNSGDAWSLNWRQYLADAVDILIGAFAFLVAYATVDGAADVLELLIAAVVAVLGIGLLLEPRPVAPRAHDIGVAK